MSKRIIFHVDVNNAFLSWTAVDKLKSGEKLDIRKIPAVIGGLKEERKGIVLAKSMPAKIKGVVTAETLLSARKKCPDLKIYPPTFSVYKEYSDAMHKILCEYSPLVERYSIDECFLDMTGTERLHGDLENLAYTIKDRIYNELGFTVNVGIGNSKLCAKMASDFSKPNKVHTLYDNEIKEKMWPLPISELFMSGKKTTEKLKQIDINTIGNLANADLNMITRKFKKLGYMLYEYANGIDDSPVISEREAYKGIGNSVTLPIDLTEETQILDVLQDLAVQVSERLRKENVLASVIVVQLKNSNFKSYSHQKKLEYGINSVNDIYFVAKNLFYKMWKEDPIRLVGLRTTDFVENKFEQMSIFNPPSIKENNKVQKLIDEINSKYNSKVIDKASLLNRNKKY